ncbi:uncharacterized protein K441DRAFT_569305 [Cenococcum geophilum 1.58]|uniref:uncharacterized protein n=1 Tax=Cenococcum geophilum 1.58 TaxID=794803 RepID=UPI00358ECDB9|nr:hypothetical protein K441DRAFT_569305 [Cenococcum geophilum 1.58]
MDKLKVIKQYLINNLDKGFIELSVLIPFILKLDRTIRLYINYYGLNKIIIKNRYLLPLVSKMLD